MRITNQWKYAQTMFDYQRGMKGVQKHNMQLSSGLKIQNSYEAAGTYNDAMRLDYEITALDQVVEATSKSQNFAKNTDKSLQEFSRQLEKFKVKLIQAASDIHSSTSLGALANDLEGIKDHLMNIANTSINGQFLFSGSAVDTKPISSNGSYHGNREEMKTISGSKVEIPFNLNGFDLFLGKDNDYHKKLTTNVTLIDQRKPNPNESPKILTEENKIKDMIGLNYVADKKTINHDYDFLENQVDFPNTYFYMQGKKPDGTSFTSKFSLTSDSSLRAMMDKIGIEFGNTEHTKVVDVNINNDGQIVVKDLTKGNHVLDMHLVAATEIVANKGTLADAINRDKDGTSPAGIPTSLGELKEAVVINGNIHITDFTKNKLLKPSDSFDFDRVFFDVKDNKIIGNISQIIRKNGEFAKDSTKLSETAATKIKYPHRLYPKDVDKNRDLYNVDNQSISLEVKSKLGNIHNIKINLGEQGRVNSRVQFEIVTTDANGAVGPKRLLSVYNADEHGEYRTQTNDFTYRQLMDIVAMAASDNIPNPQHAEPADIDTSNDPNIQKMKNDNYKTYKESVDKSKGSIDVNLDHRGRIVLTDKATSVTNIELRIYDGSNNSGKFRGESTARAQGVGSIFSFMENNSVTLDEPSIDVFKDLDKMIQAVRLGQNRADSESKDPRNTGIQGAIERIDHIMDHINKEKVRIGSHTNLLQDTNNRASLMKVNVASIKSEVIDADYAESYLSLTQKMMSYQAMLQATSKINQLSLLNYLN